MSHFETRLTRGFAQIDLLVAFIIISTALVSSVKLIQNHHITAMSNSRSKMATQLAVNNGRRLHQIGTIGLAGLSDYTALSNNAAVGILSGDKTISLGSQLPEVTYTVSWQIQGRYTDEGGLQSQAVTNGFPYPIIKEGVVTVRWHNEENETLTYSLSSSTVHPLANSTIEKILLLNRIKP